jgi:filamentous hemagglutinin
VQRQDIEAMQTQVQAEAAIKQQAYSHAAKLTDEAYRVIAQERARVYELPAGCSSSVCATEVRPEALEKAQDGKVHVANNGIYNNLERAILQAEQNAPQVEDLATGEMGKPKTQYLVYFPEASNRISEFLVSGYQETLEPVMGLSNASQLNLELISQHGADGLVLDGHSRGALTVSNAMSAALSANG